MLIIRLCLFCPDLSPDFQTGRFTFLLGTANYMRSSHIKLSMLILSSRSSPQNPLLLRSLFGLTVDPTFQIHRQPFFSHTHLSISPDNFTFSIPSLESSYSWCMEPLPLSSFPPLNESSVSKVSVKQKSWSMKNFMALQRNRRYVRSDLG